MQCTFSVSDKSGLAIYLSRVLLALGKFGDFLFQVFSVFHFGDFVLVFSNSTVTNSLVTALLKSIDKYLLLADRNFGDFVVTC